MRLPENGSIAADVLGTQSPLNEEQAFRQAFATVYGEPFDPVADKMLIDLPAEVLSLELRDRRLDIAALTLLLVHGVSAEADSLTQWDVYQQLMDRYGERGDGTASALLVGAYTAMSARSFARLADQVYGAVPHMVDLDVTPSEARHLPEGRAMRATGLALPFRGASMDFVQTNQLLHMLRNHTDADESFEASLHTLLSETTRVLAPGGQLFMVEKPLQYDSFIDEGKYLAEKSRLGDLVRGMLGYFGMSEVQVEDSADHIDGIGYLFDANRNLAAHGLTADPGTLAIYARK